jgi:hypothetical protein
MSAGNSLLLAVAKGWIMPVNFAQGTIRFISSRNSHLSDLWVIKSNPVEAKVVCFI